MITLPINQKDLEVILKLLKNNQPELYGKLWSYKINVLNKESKNGFS